jgi:hypothetical protein
MYATGIPCFGGFFRFLVRARHEGDREQETGDRGNMRRRAPVKNLVSRLSFSVWIELPLKPPSIPPCQEGRAAHRGGGHASLPGGVEFLPARSAACFLCFLSPVSCFPAVKTPPGPPLVRGWGVKSPTLVGKFSLRSVQSARNGAFQERGTVANGKNRVSGESGKAMKP